jgi:hypothetical protein
LYSLKIIDLRSKHPICDSIMIVQHTHTIQSNPIHTDNGIIGFDLILDKQDKIKLDQFTFFFFFGLPNIHRYSYKELLQYLKKKKKNPFFF